MGAMGWEGASDIAAVRAGAIGRLGGLATAIEMLMRGLALMSMPHSSAEFDVGRRLGESSCDWVDPQKVYDGRSVLRRLSLWTTQPELGQTWRPKGRYGLSLLMSSICSC